LADKSKVSSPDPPVTITSPAIKPSRITPPVEADASTVLRTVLVPESRSVTVNLPEPVRTNLVAAATFNSSRVDVPVVSIVTVSMPATITF
jgi:hypothetical protein